MLTVSIDDFDAIPQELWAEGGFISLGPDCVLDLDSDHDILIAATPSSVQAGAFTVPRRRFQKGRMIMRGKRKPCHTGYFWEDVALPNGTVKRSRRTVKLGPVGSMSKRAAAAAFQEYLNRVNTDYAPSPKSGMRLKDFVPEWRTQVGVHQSASSLRAVESHLKSHIIPRLGDIALTDFNNRAIQVFVTELATGGRTRKTCENVLNTLTGILSKAKVFGYACGQFSRRDLELPRKGEGREVRTFDAAQVGSIIAHAKEPYATMFAVLGMTGLRASEMLGLKREDLDFQRKLIQVRRSVDSRTRKVQSTKSEASRAAVPMPDALGRRLRNHLDSGWRDNPSGFLFVNQNGNTYALGKVVEYGLWPAQDAAGIKRSGLHAFRHQLASELLDGGASPAVTSKQMRHSGPAITLQAYSHVIGDSQRVAVSSVAARIEQHAERSIGVK